VYTCGKQVGENKGVSSNAEKTKGGDGKRRRTKFFVNKCRDRTGKASSSCKRPPRNLRNTLGWKRSGAGWGDDGPKRAKRGSQKKLNTGGGTHL